MERVVVAEGEFCRVECSIRADGSSPAAEALEEMARGVWAKGRSGERLPSDDQIYDCDKLLALCQYIADRGYPPHARAVNYLRSGVWELKFSNRRIPFFDTPGDGTYSPKGPVASQSEANVEDEFWWFPTFDPIVRLTHVFDKTRGKALNEDLDLCLAIREEDVEHDKE